MIGNKLRVMAAMLLVCMVFGTIAAVVYASPNLQQQRQQANQRAAEARAALEEARRLGNTLIAEMLEIEVELQEANELYEEAYIQLQETVALLEETREQLELAQARREVQYEAYRESLRFIHERGAIGYLEILFSARSFGDIIRNVEYINRIVAHDNRILDELMETERVINESLIAITLLEIEHGQIERERYATRNQLQLLHTAKQQQYDRVMADVALNERLIAEQERESERLGELIRQAEAELARQRAAQAIPAPPPMDSGATFHWPVPGWYRISSGFGNRPRPIGTGWEFHHGIDIPASANTPIVAAESGTVILSGWHGGFGITVVIYHGNGLTTLYSHNTRNLVSVGDQVRRGQQIALVGTTGHSTGNHLHFEVRQNGTSVNPMPLLGR